MSRSGPDPFPGSGCMIQYGSCVGGDLPKARGRPGGDPGKLGEGPPPGRHEVAPREGFPMEILRYPDPFLRKRVKELPEITDEDRGKIRQMFETMYAAHGVGLAATQVGWDARVFVHNVTGEPEGEEVHVNPQVVETVGEVDDEEGCLSIPGLRAKVVRAQEVLVRSTGLDGQPQEVRHVDLAARAVQHEIDHLDGILFIQRLRPSDRIRSRRLLKDLEREYKTRQNEASIR